MNRRALEVNEQVVEVNDRAEEFALTMVRDKRPSLATLILLTTSFKCIPYVNDRAGSTCCGAHGTCQVRGPSPFLPVLFLSLSAPIPLSHSFLTLVKIFISFPPSSSSFSSIEMYHYRVPRGPLRRGALGTPSRIKEIWK